MNGRGTRPGIAQDDPSDTSIEEGALVRGAIFSFGGWLIAGPIGTEAPVTGTTFIHGDEVGGSIMGTTAVIFDAAPEIN